MARLEDLDLPVVEAEAAIDRSDLRLERALVRQKDPRRAALDDRRRDGAAVDIGERLGGEDDGRRSSSAASSATREAERRSRDRSTRAAPLLPGGSDMAYFQINREAQQAEWQQVQRDLTLAIRLNERLVVGKITGENILTIRTGTQTTTMQFTLFVTRDEP